MRNLIFILVFFSLTIQSYSAHQDTLFLKTGETINCTIGKLGRKNTYYLEPNSLGIQKIKTDEIEDFIFGDNFFTMNKDKRFEYESVYYFEGFSKDEIYRAVLDWVMLNQKYFLSDGIYYSNDEFKIVLGTLYTRDFFHMDLYSIMDAIGAVSSTLSTEPVSDEDININTYSVNYEITMRAKDGRMKLYISNLTLVGSENPDPWPFIDLYNKRLNREGQTTVNYETIKKIKEILKEQIASIESHVKYVRLYGTWEDNLIKNMLLDDNW